MELVHARAQDHESPHEPSLGYTHSHSHSCKRPADHTHIYEHDVKTSVQEQYALLRYLLNHNSQHAEELHNLTHELDMKTADLIHTAVESYQEGNKKLEAALRRLKETE